jgi:hypothetical protein
MSAGTEMRKSRSKFRKALFVLIPLLVIGGGVAGYLGYSGLTTMTNGASTGSGTNTSSNVKVEFAVTITHQEQHGADFVWLAQMAMKGQYWSASCYVLCSKGVTYTLDPTTLITNDGHDFEQCKVFGSAGTVTCTAADVATVIGLSESATTPAATDTSASGPCKTTATANELETGGLADVAGTVTAGTAGSTVTTTIKNTFTAAETDNNVQVACLQTELNSGSNPIIYAEGTFGPDSLASGNTLAITWSIART